MQQQPKVPGYKLESKIGTGSFAEVYRAKHDKNDDIVAIKCIRKGSLSTGTVESIITEIKALKLLSHPHIIKMLDFLWDENFIYIIMEYCEGGDLSVYIKTYHHLKESTCRLFLCQLSSAIKYLRQHTIVHMDLKPQNLLLTTRSQPVLKLSDFGLAQFLQNREKETSLRGSPSYMAPEILLQQPYDASVDLWSTGVILFECLFGKPPYSSKNLKDLVCAIKNDKPVIIPSNIQISAECRDILTKLLVKNPNKRLSFEEFFHHPFIQQSETLPKPKLFPANARCNRDSIAHTSVGQQSTDFKTRFQAPFQELYSLAFPTPSLASALEIGIEGVQYDSEGQLTLGLARYTAALEKMIPLLKTEPKGRRKELLHQQVTLWMNRAEQIQKLLDQSHSTYEEMLSEDLGQCTIQ